MSHKKTENGSSELTQIESLDCDLESVAFKGWQNFPISKVHSKINCFDQNSLLSGTSFDTQDTIASDESESLVFSIEKALDYSKVLRCQTPNCE